LDKPSSLQIISLKEARKFLGKEGKVISDEKLLELVNQLEELARFAIERYKAEKGEVSTD